jgi:pimeloyl-ACP methyl ester carboxylesterase
MRAEIIMRFRLKNGLSIGYKTRGRGPAIVLIPAIGCLKDMWDGVIAELEDSYRCIAIEVRGHGESDVPGQAFDMDDLSDDVIEMIRAIGGGKGIVGGCSMGGQIAQGVGVKAPEILYGIFISNTGYLRNEKIREVMEARAVACAQGMSGPVWTTLNRWFNEDYRRAHPEHVKLAYDWLINADPIVHAWSWRAIKGLGYAEQLKSLKVPALAIAGELDQSSAPEEVEAMAKALPNCMYRMCKGAGHLSPVESPREYAAFLREFADKVTR